MKPGEKLMGKSISLRQAEQKIKNLREKIVCHEKKYYVDNNPQISDYEFDLLVKRLEKLEKQFPELISPDSPTQRVGEEALEGFASVRHRTPMLSLDNCYSIDELVEFEERIRKVFPVRKIEYVAELKIDGLGISIIYHDGKFDRAITRGDGYQGDDVTANVKTIRSLPLSINTNKAVEIRGEIYLPFSSFKRINKEREKNGVTLFANPRNAAAGSIRLLDPKEVAIRKLDIFLYSIFIDGVEQDSQWDNLKKLKELGFKINTCSSKCKSLEEVVSFYKEMLEQRDSLDYDIDGIVMKVNSVEQQKLLGSTAKFPRWAISFKFPARQATSRIKNIIIQVGRTGALTPVAVLEPVKISGITISRSTLHNEDEIKRKDIRIGDYVLIERSGDVIPKIVSVMKERRTGKEVEFVFPKTCPVCSSSTFKPEGEAISRCTNPSCPAKLKQSILHFSSRRAMNIENLGQALVDQLLEKKLVEMIPDLYSLRLEDIAALERMGLKSSRNLLGEIEKSKQRGLDRLIYAIGIRYVGERTTRTLSLHFDSLDALSKASLEELIKIEDVGQKVAESISFFFRQPENIELVNKLKEVGINFYSRRLNKNKGAPLAGQAFVFTGKLSSLTREETKRMIEDLGGRVSASVSTKTTYVVAGESPGTKLLRAQKLGVTILTELEFLKLVNKFI